MVLSSFKEPSFINTKHAGSVPTTLVSDARSKRVSDLTFLPLNLINPLKDLIHLFSDLKPRAHPEPGWESLLKTFI